MVNRKISDFIFLQITVVPMSLSCHSLLILMLCYTDFFHVLVFYVKTIVFFTDFSVYN